MTGDNQKSGCQLWVKLFIGVTVAAVLVLVGLFGWALYMASNATKPEFIERVAAGVADIAPLPANYRYKFAVESKAGKGVCIEHEPDEHVVMIVRAREDGSSLGTYLQRHLNSENFSGVTSRGSYLVAGQEMSYAVGKKMVRGKEIQVLIGYIKPDSEDYIIQISGEQRDGQAYNHDRTRAILGAIKSF